LLRPKRPALAGRSSVRLRYALLKTNKVAPAAFFLAATEASRSGGKVIGSTTICST
jgi:hypothetical protein